MAFNLIHWTFIFLMDSTLEIVWPQLKCPINCNHVFSFSNIQRKTICGLAHTVSVNKTDCPTPVGIWMVNVNIYIIVDTVFWGHCSLFNHPRLVLLFCFVNTGSGWFRLVPVATYLLLNLSSLIMDTNEGNFLQRCN